MQHRRTRTCLAILAVAGPLAAPAWAAAPAAKAPPGLTNDGAKAAEMVDLRPDHWAYPAIELLMDRYHIMGGYPDKTFRGTAMVDRYQLAAMLARIMDKIQALGPGRVDASDQALINRLKQAFSTELAEVQSDHAELAALEARLGITGASGSVAAGATGSVALPLNLPKPPETYPNNKLAAHLSTTILDDPQDKLFPYWVSKASVTFKGALSPTQTASFGLRTGTGPLLASSAPAIAGGSKVPVGDVKLSGSAALQSKFPGGISSTAKFGYFAIGDLIGTNGFDDHFGDGIIGNGLQGPSGNPVRPNFPWTGGQDETLAGKVELKGFAVAGGLTSQFLEGGLGYKGNWGNVNLLADVDHDSIGSVVLTKARAYDVGASLNLGSSKAGIMIQGGVAGSGNFLQDSWQPLASLEGVLSLQTFNKNLPGIEFGAGGSYKQGTEATQPNEELLPSAYIYVPALRPGFPTFLAALAGPYTLAAHSPTAGTGFVPSPLNDKAGWTLQSVIDNPVLPKLTLEVDLQQDVLFGPTYDGWGYAISSSINF